MIKAAWRRAYHMIDAAERFKALENVHQNGNLVDKTLPQNESQVRPLVDLSDAEAVHVWGQVVETHEREAKWRLTVRRGTD